jgi:hypothetical protein
MSEVKVLPLPKIDARYGPMGGKYPERVRIPMSDGKVISYRIEIQQPAPVFRERLDRFRKLCIGYVKPADKAPDENEGGNNNG